MRIPHVARVQRFGVVDVPHTNQATFVQDDQGIRWIAKRRDEMGSEGLMAEAITWLLAGEIGAPVPLAAFCDAPDEHSWLSRYVPMTAHWTPEVAPFLVDPASVGAILALDLLVINEARHRRNLLVQLLDDGGARVWAIDGEEAVIGYPADYMARGDGPLRVANHARGLPIDALAAGARAAAARAACFDPETIHDLVVESATVSGMVSAGLAEGILRRGRSLPDLLEPYLAALRAL